MTLFLLLTGLVAVTFALPASAAGSLDETMAGILGPIGSALSGVVFYEFEMFGTSISWIVVWMGLPMLF
ncbi:MAG: hypothetical protein V3R73_02040, partial [Sphingomonadales bacterium]